MIYSLVDSDVAQAIGIDSILIGWKSFTVLVDSKD